MQVNCDLQATQLFLYRKSGAAALDLQSIYTTMSYYVQSYLTDAAKVKAIWGCKNPKFLEAITRKLSDDLDDLDDTFAAETTDEKNALQVLTDIINGEIRFPELGFLYVYVYEKLVQVFGKITFPPNDEYDTNYYQSIDKEVCKTFFPLPAPSDFPEVYSILQADLAQEKIRFLSMDKIKGIAPSELVEHKADFEFIFDKAIAEGKDLVFLVY